MRNWWYFLVRSLAAGFITAVVLPSVSWAQGMMAGRGGMMDGWGMMSPVMWIFMLLLWGFAILGVVCAIRWLVNRGKLGGGRALTETPLEILKKRYAKGEIGKEEFERMKKELE